MSRPSVFERLGRKKEQTGGSQSSQTRLHSTVVVREWPELDFADADADALEKRRQQLQRELGLDSSTSDSSSSASNSNSTSTGSSSSSTGSTTTRSSAGKKPAKQPRGGGGGGTPPLSARPKRRSRSPPRHRAPRASSARKPRSRSRPRPRPHRRDTPPPPRRRPPRPEPKPRNRPTSSDRRKEKQRKERDHHRIAHREKEREEALARCQERQRERERLKEQQQAKRGGQRTRDRGLNKGLEKPGPDKPVERLLPRPEERLAALAATKRLSLERASKSDQRQSDRSSKRTSDRRPSVERPERPYDRSRSSDRSYGRRSSQRYDEMVNVDRSPAGGYAMPAHDRDAHYAASPYDHARGYLDPEDRVYDDRHSLERGFVEDRRNSRRDDMSWDGREASLDPDRQYIHHSQHPHSHKEWENDDYHADWNRQDRHWQRRDSQHKGRDWVDKDREVESSWHGHRQGSSSNSKTSRSRENSNYRSRSDHSRGEGALHSSSKRSRVEVQPEIVDVKKASSTHSSSGQASHPAGDLEGAPVPDDLSEISDDADEILNRDDEPLEVAETAVKGDTSDNQSSIDPYGMMDLQTFKPDYEPMPDNGTQRTGSKVHKDSNTSAKNDSNVHHKENNSEHKIESSQDNDGEDGLDNLDFEEISDGELEEDQKAKVLGDALGVDWASLVAEVRRKKEKITEEGADDQNKTGAREYWKPQKVLARIGVSLNLAGREMIDSIFADDTGASKSPDGHQLMHPVASIQVAMERRRRQRLSLFGTETGFTRALCARQDLALRRYLCNLPINECGQEIHPPEPHLFEMAQKLIQKAA